MRARLAFLIITAASQTAVADAPLRPAVSSATAAPDPVAETQALEGPFASLEDWCKSQKAPGFRCYLANDDPDPAITLPMPFSDPWLPGDPWRRVRVFAASSAGGETCVLGVLIKRGWFLRELVDCTRSEVSVQLRVEDVIDSSRGKELQLRIRGIEQGNAKTGYTDSDGIFHIATTSYRDELESLIVCGVGQSRTPRCTSAIQLTPEFPESEDSDVALTATWSRGDLILSRAGGSPDDEEHGRLAPPLQELVGRHHIVFP